MKLFEDTAILQDQHTYPKDMYCFTETGHTERWIGIQEGVLGCTPPTVNTWL